MHFPVLLKEVISNLELAPGDVILDATLGGGGHAIEIAKRIVPSGRLIALDRDPEAIERTKKRLVDFLNETIFINDNFRNIETVLKAVGEDGIDGAIFDLGISSFHLDDGGRGFSFLREGPLDMRFDLGKGFSASDVVNSFSEEQLADIVKEYGEERHSKLVARAIVAFRKKKKIETTLELADIVKRAVGFKYRKQRLNPAARTFQALRIFVNDELAAIEEGVRKTISFLRYEGRICVISFHSLEDRIIKNIFRELAKSGKLKLITKKPITPSREEIRKNPKARSAKLRVAEKIS